MQLIDECLAQGSSFMKTLTRYAVLFGLLACSAIVMRAVDPDETPDPNGPNCEDCGSTLFMLRPQGLNSAAIFNPFYFGCCDTSLDASFTFTLGYRYEQTFDSKNIARCLFGAPTLSFAGHNALTTAPNDSVQAENFGLSPDFLGTITFDPIVQNHNIDFTSRFEFGSVWDNLEGVYCMLNATLTNSRWNLRTSQTPTVNTTANITTMPQCLNDIIETNNAFPNIETALQQTAPFGQVTTPATYGRFMFNHVQTKTALANVDLILGYDFLKCDGYHFGVFLKTVAPTGNRPNPEIVFSPLVGNGHHWEFGGGADAHWDIWTCDDQCITAYIYGNLTHLFDDKQWHTFKLYDLEQQTSCCLSQYTLLKEFNNAVPPVFQDKLIRATDFTTRYINSSFNVQGDATLRFVYTTRGWAFGLGYNVYGRSEEDIQLLDTTLMQDIDAKQYGIKGDTGVCARCPAGNILQLNATKATCVSSAGTMEATPVDRDPTATTGCSAGSTAQTWYGTPAFSSNPPQILDQATNIYFKGVPRQITSKVFGTIDYQWQYCNLTPFIGGGVEVEFPFSRNCYVCTPSQWGVWFHGGLEF